jgi:hypothetical protein
MLMRSTLPILACWALMGSAQAQGAPSAALQNCVPSRDMPDVVASSGVVAPAAAVMTARRQVPNADVVRANLCRSGSGFVYVIMALRKDGRVVQVMIDGPSGRVQSVQ